MREAGPPDRHVTVSLYATWHRRRCLQSRVTSRQHRNWLTAAKDKSPTGSAHHSSVKSATLASRQIFRSALSTSRTLLTMTPKQATLGYVRSSQTTLGCVDQLPSAHHHPSQLSAIVFLIADDFQFVASSLASQTAPNLRPPARQLSHSLRSPRPRRRPLKTRRVPRMTLQK